MIADHLVRRMWSYDGEDRRVEVWLRHDGQWYVVALRRLDERRGWREVDSTFANSQAAAMATAQAWMTREEARMK
jgi:glucan-binding YG repeat protein